MDERTEKSLSKLKSYVLNDAHKMRDKLSEETENIISSRVEEKRKSLNALRNKNMDKELTAIKRENKAMLQGAELMAKKELLKCRKEIADDIFDAVMQEIKSFKESSEYEKWLNKTAQQAILDCGEAAEIFVSADDIKKLDLENVSVMEIMGGVVAKNLKRGITADYSLDTLLKEAREDFTKTSGLTIEI